MKCLRLKDSVTLRATTNWPAATSFFRLARNAAGNFVLRGPLRRFTRRAGPAPSAAQKAVDRTPAPLGIADASGDPLGMVETVECRLTLRDAVNPIARPVLPDTCIGIPNRRPKGRSRFQEQLVFPLCPFHLSAPSGCIRRRGNLVGRRRICPDNSPRRVGKVLQRSLHNRRCWWTPFLASHRRCLGPLEFRPR